MTPSSYVVRPGDTLSAIGRRFGMNYQDIAKMNNLPNANLIRAGSTLRLNGGAPGAPSASAPMPSPANQVNPSNTINVGGMNIPVPTARTPFSQVMPYDKVFNPSLITGLAESQVNPEIQRQYTQDAYGLGNQQAQTGGYRSGMGANAQQNLADQYERQRKEQVMNFTDTINNNATDWYNQQYKQYNQNPSGFVAPQLQTFDQFSQANPNLANAYNQQTNISNQFKNPYLF